MSCFLCITALTFYEYLITFKYEINFLWRRKRGAATWIFVYNRYLLLTSVVSMIVPYSAQVSNPADVQAPVAEVLCRCKLPLANGTCMFKLESVCFVNFSCDNPTKMNTLNFFTGGEIPTLPSHGKSSVQRSLIQPLSYSRAQYSQSCEFSRY